MKGSQDIRFITVEKSQVIIELWYGYDIILNVDEARDVINRLIAATNKIEYDT